MARQAVEHSVTATQARVHELMREAGLARFEQLSRVAGLAAEARGVTEEQLEREMDEIRQRRHQEAYG